MKRLVDPCREAVSFASLELVDSVVAVHMVVATNCRIFPCSDASALPWNCTIERSNGDCRIIEMRWCRFVYRTKDQDAKRSATLEAIIAFRRPFESF